MILMMMMMIMMILIRLMMEWNSCQYCLYMGTTHLPVSKQGTTVTATNTSLKTSHATSNFIALIPTHSIRQMFANFSGVEF